MNSVERAADWPIDLEIHKCSSMERRNEWSYERVTGIQDSIKIREPWINFWGRLLQLEMS